MSGSVFSSECLFCLPFCRPYSNKSCAHIQQNYRSMSYNIVHSETYIYAVFSDVQFLWRTAERQTNVDTNFGMNSLKSFGLNGHKEFQTGGYLCSSIKGWAVIKAHFYLNECKLAHLLWWSSCPDSSISMIDQLSSCWWFIGNGGLGAGG